MAKELKEGDFAVLFTRLAEEGNNRGRFSLRPLALALEKQAKINASVGSHKFGTKTPAVPGTGPSVISGNLRRSITHTPIIKGDQGWETKVGTAIGMFPSYPVGHKRQPANVYGKILEITGLRNGATYPFLIPAFNFVTGVPAKIIYDEIYGATWKKVF